MGLFSDLVGRLNAYGILGSNTAFFNFEQAFEQERLYRMQIEQHVLEAAKEETREAIKRGKDMAQEAIKRSKDMANSGETIPKKDNVPIWRKEKFEDAEFTEVKDEIKLIG